MTDANAEVARLAKRISAKSALAMSDGKYHTLRADYALALRRQRDEQEKMRGGTVSDSEDKNLWGKHGVTGRWVEEIERDGWIMVTPEEESAAQALATKNGRSVFNGCTIAGLRQTYGPDNVIHVTGIGWYRKAR